MGIDQHKQGGGVAKAIRQRVQAEDDIRKARTLNPRDQAEEIQKRAADTRPVSNEFYAALQMYADQLTNGAGSVSVGEAAQRQAMLEASQAKGDVDTAEIQQTDQELSDMGAAAGQTPNPQGKEKLPPNAFTKPSDGSAEPVRKSVRSQIREIFGMED
jgi:hypothetical protein